MRVSQGKIFHCKFCSKYLLREHAMVNHERFCSKNPENSKACGGGCIHLEEVEIEWYRDNGYDHGESVIKSNCFKCKQYNKFLYGFRAEKQRLAEKYPEQFENQSPMPRNCRHFEDGYGHHGV